MCNFMGVRVTKVEFIKLRQIEKALGTLAALKELELMKDGFRYSNAAVLRKTSATDFEVVPMHWEFIPVWIKSMDDVLQARKQGIPWLNATAEKLLDSKMFRHAALNRRCLVLATHFYEWRHYKPDGAKKEQAYPYLVTTSQSDYFYMAGIWQPFTDKTTGETMDTFAIVTTKANELMEVVHNKKKRMPAILTEDLAWEWLMEDISEERIKEIASFQISSEALSAYTIAKDFKTALDPTAPFEYDELPPLDIAL